MGKSFAGGKDVSRIKQRGTLAGKKTVQKC